MSGKPWAFIGGQGRWLFWKNTDNLWYRLCDTTLSSIPVDDDTSDKLNCLQAGVTPRPSHWGRKMTPVYEDEQVNWSMRKPT